MQDDATVKQSMILIDLAKKIKEKDPEIGEEYEV